MAKLVPTLVHPLKSKFFSNHHSFITKHSFQLYGFQSKHSYSSSSSKISMSLKAGIVGLPNVGKSTLFNAVVSILIFLYLFFGFLCITWNEGSLFCLLYSYSFIQFWVFGCLSINHKLYIFFDRYVFEKMTQRLSLKTNL
jgi:hypothetical protein